MSLNFSQILEGSYTASLKRTQSESATMSTTMKFPRTVSHTSSIVDAWPSGLRFGILSVTSDLLYPRVT